MLQYKYYGKKLSAGNLFCTFFPLGFDALSPVDDSVFTSLSELLILLKKCGLGFCSAKQVAGSHPASHRDVLLSPLGVLSRCMRPAILQT